MTFKTYYFLTERKYYTQLSNFTKPIAAFFTKMHHKLQPGDCKHAQVNGIKMSLLRIKEKLYVVNVENPPAMDTKNLKIQIAVKDTISHCNMNCVGLFISAQKNKSQSITNIELSIQGVKLKAQKTGAAPATVLQDTMVHELTHAFDELQHKAITFSADAPLLDQPHERNAYINEFVQRTMQTQQVQRILQSTTDASQQIKQITDLIVRGINKDMLQKKSSNLMKQSTINKWKTEIYKAVAAAIQK